MGRGTIISLGSINKDVQVRTNRWPKPGETLMATDLLTIGGGKAANRAFLIKKLGGICELIGRVGEDVEAGEAIKSLINMGVELKYVKSVRGQKTGLSMIAVREDGDKSILLAGNANENWEPEGADDVEKIILEAPQNSVLVVDLEIPDRIVARALSAAKERAFCVVLDPSPTDNFQEQYYQSVNFLVPNLSEAENLVEFSIRNIEDGFRACDVLSGKGIPNVIIKMSEMGYVLRTGSERFFQAAPKIDVVDTTGAGDAFAGALAFALWENRGVFDALRFAVAVSSLAVEGYGSQPAYPDREKIEEMIISMDRLKSF